MYGIQKFVCFFICFLIQLTYMVFIWYNSWLILYRHYMYINNIFLLQCWNNLETLIYSRSSRKNQLVHDCSNWSWFILIYTIDSCRNLYGRKFYNTQHQTEVCSLLLASVNFPQTIPIYPTKVLLPFYIFFLPFYGLPDCK